MAQCELAAIGIHHLTGAIGDAGRVIKSGALAVVKRTDELQTETAGPGVEPRAKIKTPGRQ